MILSPKHNNGKPVQPEGGGGTGDRTPLAFSLNCFVIVVIVVVVVVVVFTIQRILLFVFSVVEHSSLPGSLDSVRIN